MVYVDTTYISKYVLLRLDLKLSYSSEILTAALVLDGEGIGEGDILKK